MTFWGKVSLTLTNMKEKVTKLVKIGRLKSKVRTERFLIEKVKKQMGEIQYKRYQEGATYSPEVLELCNAIDGHEKVILLLLQEINLIKNEGK